MSAPIMMPGRVLVQPLDTDEAMPGGRIVLLPETRANITAGQAEVVAAAVGCDPRLTPGAWVVLRQWQPVAALDGCYVVREADIVAVLVADP